MKTKQTLLSLLEKALILTALQITTYAAGDVALNPTHFPYPAFLKYFKSPFYDRNGDSILPPTEIANMKAPGFTCDYPITDLTGIEHLTALKSTCIADLTGLTSFDFSKNLLLTFVDCQNNSINHLNVSKNTLLNTLVYSSNALMSLDLPQNIATLNYKNQTIWAATYLMAA